MRSVARSPLEWVLRRLAAYLLGWLLGFAAIPVVGWIGLAAMGLNMITGGGLFGTAAKPTGSGGERQRRLLRGGASWISAALDEKGKKAFFGGSYYKTVNEPALTIWIPMQ